MNKINKLILGSVGLAAAVLGVYKAFQNREPSKYSCEWIEKLTDKEWKTEREMIRQKFCDPKYDIAARTEFQNLLKLFDKVKRDRDGAGLKPDSPAYYREHGYHLYKP